MAASGFQHRQRMRTAGFASSAFLIAVLASGCGDGADRADTVPSPTSLVSDPTETSEPDSPVTGPAETSVADTVATPTSAEPPAPTTIAPESADPPPDGGSDPAAIILTLDDLPTGWSASADDEEDDEDDGDDSCLDSIFRDSDLMFADNAANPTAKASFSGPDLVSFLTAAVATDVDDAGHLFDGLAEGFAACDGTTDAEGYTYSVLPLTFPALGDNTFATRIDGANDESFPVSILLAITRVDDVVVLTANIGIGGVDAVLFEQTTRTMVDRI